MVLTQLEARVLEGRVPDLLRAIEEMKAAAQGV
jgi:hypothetical protein